MDVVENIVYLREHFPELLSASAAKYEIDKYGNFTVLSIDRSCYSVTLRIHNPALLKVVSGCNDNLCNAVELTLEDDEYDFISFISKVKLVDDDCIRVNFSGYATAVERFCARNVKSMIIWCDCAVASTDVLCRHLVKINTAMQKLRADIEDMKKFMGYNLTSHPPLTEAACSDKCTQAPAC